MRAKINATGCIGRDAQKHTLANGMTVYRFPMATNTVAYGPNGCLYVSTEWHKCETWVSAHDDHLFAMLRKGTRLAISGELKYHKWLANTLAGKRTVKQAYIKVVDLEIIKRKHRR